jgi:putative MFS transporter
MLTAGIGVNVIFAIFCVSILIGALAVAFLGTETKQLELE